MFVKIFPLLFLLPSVAFLLPGCIACVDADVCTFNPEDSATSGEVNTDSDTEADTDGQDDWSQCLLPDPEAKANYAFDLSVWDPDFTPEDKWGEKYGIDFEATCVVDGVDSVQGTHVLDMICNDANHFDQPIQMTFDLPQDIEFPLAVSDPVTFRFNGEVESHHDGQQSQFAIYNSSGQLLITGFDKGEGNLALVDIGTGLDFTSLNVDCPSPCGPDVEECSEFQRLSVEVKDGQGAWAQELDQHRGLFEWKGLVYDYIVARALTRICLNCGSEYHVLLVIQ